MSISSFLKVYRDIISWKSKGKHGGGKSLKIRQNTKEKKLSKIHLFGYVPTKATFITELINIKKLPNVTKKSWNFAKLHDLQMTG